jgi:hypothetical protein
MADIEVKKINQLPLAGILDLPNDLLALEQGGIAKKIPIATLRQNDAGALDTGTLSMDRIGAGAITDAKIADLAATKLTGTLSMDRIATGAITDAKIADLAATKLTGTLADARLSANVPKLKSGSGLNVDTMFPAEQVIVQCYNGMGGTFPIGYTVVAGDMIQQYVWDTNSKFQVVHSDARGDWLWHRQSVNSSTWGGWAFIGSSLSYSINSNFTVDMLAVGQSATLSNYSGGAVTITCSNGNLFQIVGSTNTWVGIGASFSLASGGSISIKREN